MTTNNETMLVSEEMFLTELSISSGAVFRHNDDDTVFENGAGPSSVVYIPRNVWESYGRPTEVYVRISTKMDA